MKTKFFITTCICAILLSISSNFAYASNGEECEACNTTSPYVDNYINFANELIKSFLTFANQEAYTFQQQGQTNVTNGGNQVNTNTENQFVKTDLSRSLQAITDNLNQKTQMAASSAFVFGLVVTETAFLDSWKNISPMMNGKAILRDWEKINTVGQSISNTLLDLGNNGVFERLGFRDGWNERILEILKRYSSMDNAPITYLGSDKVFSQPREILGALRRMNQALKTTVGLGRYDIIDNSDNKFLQGTLIFSIPAQESLVEYYTCARGTAGISCSTSGKRAKDNLNNTRKETSEKTKGAKDIIVNAMKRLSAFRSKNGNAEALKLRQNELLRSEYGRQGVRNNQGDTIGQGLKKGAANGFGFKETRKTLKNDTEAVGPFAGLKQVNIKPQGEEFSIQSQQSKEQIKIEKAAIKNTFDSVLENTRKDRKESTYSNVDQVTKLFPLITAEIVSSKKIIEETGKGVSIVENLGKACDLQCSNLGGKCWYQ